MTRFSKHLLAFVVFLIPTAHANEAFNLQHLKQLFDAYQRQAAYEYAYHYIKDMEGDPYFDYLYGVSAIDTGHASQGVFALERVLLVFPQDHVARLELARGYFILEEYSRSRKEFEAVMKTQPPLAVQQTAQGYLDQIRLKEARYHTTSNGHIELAMGTDSNVNGGADDDALILINLSTESLEQDDSFSDLTAAWQITHPIAPGLMIDGAITANSRMNSELDQYNTLTSTLQLGMTKLVKDSRYKAGLIFQQFDLDGEDYRSLYALNLDWHYAQSQKTRYTTSLQFAQLDYPDQSVRNSELITLSLGYQHAFSGALSPLVFSNLNVGMETAEEGTNPNALADTERDILGLKLGMVLSFTPKLALQTTAGWQNSQYAGEQTFVSFSGITRDDDYVTVDASLIWLFYNQWRLDTKFAYSSNSSNVEIHNHNRQVISLNLNYAF